MVSLHAATVKSTLVRGKESERISGRRMCAIHIYGLKTSVEDNLGHSGVYSRICMLSNDVYELQKLQNRKWNGKMVMNGE
jgi:hypothetical protein